MEILRQPPGWSGRTSRRCKSKIPGLPLVLVHPRVLADNQKLRIRQCSVEDGGYPQKQPHIALRKIPRGHKANQARRRGDRQAGAAECAQGCPVRKTELIGIDTLMEDANLAGGKPEAANEVRPHQFGVGDEITKSALSQYPVMKSLRLERRAR
jgi:hypothetical protein